MSEQTDNPTSEGDPGRCNVHQVARLEGITDRDLISAVCAATEGRRLREISVAVVDDPTIADLHGQFLDDPSPTDVLTFDLRDEPDDTELEGEIIVSADTARRVAGELGLAPRQELLRYVIHGALHLLGLDDQTDEQRAVMRAEEDRVLAGLAGSTGDAGEGN